TLNLEVTDVEAALRAVRNLATAANGIVFSSSSEYKGTVLVATITIQVPGEQFDPVMTSVRKIGQRVTSEVSSSQDVTEEYIDLSSQLKNLQAQEDQLRVLMGRAGTVDEVLRVQHELSDVQGHMEQIQGRLNYLSHRTEFSTITTNLAPPGGPAATDWQPLATATQSWQASLAVLARLTDALVGVLVFSWWMIVLLVLAVVLLRRRRRRPVRLPPAPPVA
ncbi:MAG TPA: DUF4349 domain-containing protein, partial [Chloroflexia bacterium]|nr:DUF4349 domain-containing protein [Chloroflexia bacterium]